MADLLPGVVADLAARHNTTNGAPMTDEPCVCDTAFTCMAGEHDDPTPPPGLWWSPTLGVIEQVDIPGDEALYQRLTADDDSDWPLAHRLPSDAIELVAAPTEAECDAAFVQDEATKAVAGAWREARRADEVRARDIPVRVWKTLDTLVRVQDGAA